MLPVFCSRCLNEQHPQVKVNARNSVTNIDAYIHVPIYLFTSIVYMNHSLPGFGDVSYCH